jgi:hypothetical protein
MGTSITVWLLLKEDLFSLDCRARLPMPAQHRTASFESDRSE